MPLVLCIKSENSASLQAGTNYLIELQQIHDDFNVQFYAKSRSLDSHRFS